MIGLGSFPFVKELEVSVADVPRVGDGVMVLDADARVQYASPNAVSAVHRVGINANLVGLRLAELGFNDSVVRAAFDERTPALEEFEQTAEITLVTRCIPLLDGRAVTGGVLLVRDVSELRRRDRMLLSKDATIREIHHRVKNNLQTIASLLRLQARRSGSPAMAEMLNQSITRILSIAVVHEFLSHDEDSVINIHEVCYRILTEVTQGILDPTKNISLTLEGHNYYLATQQATSCALIINELLQNAVEHGYAHRAEGTIQVRLRDTADSMTSWWARWTAKPSNPSAIAEQDGHPAA
jgi:two-component sensor histidine kinase